MQNKNTFTKTFLWLVFLLAINCASVKAIPPSLVNSTPLDDATGVSVNTGITLVFDQPITSIGGGNFGLHCDGPGFCGFPNLGACAGFSGVGTNTLFLGFTYLSAKDYHFTFDSDCFANAGMEYWTGISNSTDLNFTTVADVTNPTISALSPIDNGTGVSPSTNLVITFSEAVDVETGSIAIRRLSDNAPIHSIAVNSGLVTGSGTNTTTINPSSDLDPSTGYYIEIDATAFDDPAGNSFAGIVGNSTWNFTTGALDTTPPNCTIALSPLDNVTTVGLNDNLVMTCDENVQAGTGNIIITHTGVGTFESIPIGDPRVTISGSTVTVNPTGTFASLTDYHVTIAAGVIEDTSGNDFAGISTSTAWNFTTEGSGVCSPNIMNGNSIYGNSDIDFSVTNDPGEDKIIFNKPAGVNADNLLIALVTSATLPITAPPDWTLYLDQSNVRFYYKIAGASEPLTYEFPMGASTDFGHGLLFTFKDVSTSNPIAGYGFNGDSATFAAPSYSYPRIDGLGAGDYEILRIAMHNDSFWCQDDLGLAADSQKVLQEVCMHATLPPAFINGISKKETAPILEYNSQFECAMFGMCDASSENYLAFSFALNEALPDPGACPPSPPTCSDSFHYRSSSSEDNDDGMGFYNSIPDGFGGNLTWLTLNKPIGTIANDILIAAVSVQNSSVNITAPVGWTLMASRNYTSGPISIKSSIYYKVAGGSEPADYTFYGDSDAYSMSAVLATYNGQDFGGTPSPSFIYSINNGTYSYASPAHSYPALNSIPANDTIARFITTGPQGVSWVGSVGNLPDYTIRDTHATMPSSRFVMLQDRDTHTANQALTSFSYSCSGPPDSCGFDTNIPYITYTVAFGGGNCSGAPNPVSFTPADNSTNVNIADNLTIEFDEDIQKGSAGTIQIIRTSDSAVFETFAIGSGLVTVSGDTVTINPTSNLLAGVAYHVIISSGYIENLSGNDWAGISTSTDWNFTTLDNVAPNCTVTLSPLDNATGVGLNANLVMSCNENVQAGTGNIIITHTGVGTFESIPIGDPRVTFSGSTVTINPTGTFASLTGYHVTLAAGVIEDISGNDFAGILNATDWNFMTMIASSCNGTPIFNGTHLATGVDGQYLDSADIDGDGDLDFVVSSVNDDDVLWYENDGSQNFTMRTIDSNLDQPGNVKISDVDQDGDLDIVAAGRGDDVIVWYRNDGSENFTKLIIDASINGPDTVDVSDIDGDGDLDIVGSATIDDIINWYENDGNENFTNRNVVPFLNGVGYVKAVDFDGDGDEDVVASAFHADEVNWYENDGSQNFTEHNIGVGNGPYYSEVIDFDGDGDLDVVAPIYNDGEVVWFENDGSFNFTKNVIATGISGAYAVKVDNLDKDGDLDVVVTNLLAGTVNWLENDGSQNFTVHSFGTPSISSSRSIEAVYFDGNDAIDIVIVSTGTDALTSFEAANCIGGSLPVISNLNPLDNATGVSDSANLVMSFSENVIADSGNILIRLMSDNSIVESIPVGDPRVTGTGTNTITVNPSVTLAPSTAYYVEVGATAFEDLSGNSFAGMTGNSIWNFTVLNPFALDLLSVTPLKNRLNVGVDITLSLKFSNPVFIGSGDLRVYETVGNVLVDTIPAGSARVYGAGSNTINIYPINGLNFNTHYYITMDSGFLNGGSVIQPVNAVLPGEWFFRTRRSAAEAPTF